MPEAAREKIIDCVTAAAVRGADAWVATCAQREKATTKMNVSDLMR